MEVEAKGKYIDEKNNSKNVKGSLKITDWIKSEKSQDPEFISYYQHMVSSKMGIQFWTMMFPKI